MHHETSEAALVLLQPSRVYKIVSALVVHSRRVRTSTSRCQPLPVSRSCKHDIGVATGLRHATIRLSCDMAVMNMPAIWLHVARLPALQASRSTAECCMLMCKH